jgi:hypothetical protein
MDQAGGGLRSAGDGWHPGGSGEGVADGGQDMGAVLGGGFGFWVMRDPWENEFCVLQTEFPELSRGWLPLTRGGCCRSGGQPELCHDRQPVEIDLGPVQLAAADLDELTAGQNQ